MMSMDSIASMNMPIAKGMLGWIMLGTFAILLLIMILASLKRGDRGAKVQWWP